MLGAKTWVSDLKKMINRYLYSFIRDTFNYKILDLIIYSSLVRLKTNILLENRRQFYMVGHSNSQESYVHTLRKANFPGHLKYV